MEKITNLFGNIERLLKNKKTKCARGIIENSSLRVPWLVTPVDAYPTTPAAALQLQYVYALIQQTSCLKISSTTPSIGPPHGPKTAR